MGTYPDIFGTGLKTLDSRIRNSGNMHYFLGFLDNIGKMVKDISLNNLKFRKNAVFSRLFGRFGKGIEDISLHNTKFRKNAVLSR